MLRRLGLALGLWLGLGGFAPLPAMAQGQALSPIAVCQALYNSTIVPNGAGEITGPVMNTALMCPLTTILPYFGSFAGGQWKPFIPQGYVSPAMLSQSYLASNGSGAQLTGITPAQIGALAVNATTLPASFVSAPGLPFLPTSGTALPSNYTSAPGLPFLLANGSGAGLTGILAAQIGYTAPFTGAVAEALNSYLARTTWIDDASAAGDGKTDDATKFAMAAAGFGGKPGTIRLTQGKVYRVSSLNLPSGVVVQGAVKFPDDPGTQSSLFGSMGGLVLDSTGTVTEHSGSGLEDMVIYRTGMTFPASDSSQYAGTAVSCSTNTRANRPANHDLLILGFAQAMNFTNCDRPEAIHVFGDDLNGLYQSGSGDTSIFDHVRFWPYATVGFGPIGYAVTSISGNGTTATLNYTLPPGSAAPVVGDPINVSGSDGFAGSYTVASTPASGQLTYANATNGSRGASGNIVDTHLVFDRPGVAFSLNGQTDDTHLTNALSFGYHHGYDFLSNGNVFADKLWQDPATIADTTQVGFNFGNQFDRSTLGQISANGGYPAVLFANNNGRIAISNLFVTTSVGAPCISAPSGSDSIGLLVAGGCNTSSIDLANSTHLAIGTATIVHTGNNTTTPPIRWLSGTAMTTAQLQIGKLYTDLSPGAARDGVNNPSLPTINTGSSASSYQIQLPQYEDDFQLAGTGIVTSITGGWTGREVVFTASGTVQMYTGGNIYLAGGSNWQAASGATIALRFNALGDGTWREEWRAGVLGNVFFSGHIAGNGSAPSITSSSGTASLSAAANDNNGTITNGATASNVVTLSFAASRANVPDCIVQAIGNGLSASQPSRPTTSSMQVSFSAANAQATYICFGQ